MPTGRKRPGLIRLPAFLSQLSAVVARAADVPDGFTRQLRLTFRLDEPGKGTKPSPRDIHLHLTPGDARRMAYRLLAEADTADAQNTEHGNGGHYTDHWDSPLPVLKQQATPDPPSADRIPRLHATGRHYYAYDAFDTVEVIERTDEVIVLRTLGTDDGITELPRADGGLGTLVMDGGDNDWETV